MLGSSAFSDNYRVDIQKQHREIYRVLNTIYDASISVDLTVSNLRALIMGHCISEEQNRGSYVTEDHKDHHGAILEFLDEQIDLLKDAEIDRIQFVTIVKCAIDEHELLYDSLFL